MDQEAASRTACGTVHEAVPYSTPVRLAAELGAVLGGAVAAGEPVLAVLEPPERSALETELGTAADRVEWLEPAQVHRVPAFTVAVRWARRSRRAARPEERTTIVVQHAALPGLDQGHWPRLDAALGVALADLPITMLCASPEDRGLDLLRATHPALRIDGSSLPTARPPDPVAIVAEYPQPPPAELGEPTAELTFTILALPAVRRLVAATAQAAGIGPERVADLVLAVNEIATNSVEHGPGAGRLRLWALEGPGVLAEVHDIGRIDVPFPGLVAPPPAGERGRGLWLASELSDVLQVWDDHTGTIVRLLVE